MTLLAIFPMSALGALCCVGAVVGVVALWADVLRGEGSFGVALAVTALAFMAFAHRAWVLP